MLKTIAVADDDPIYLTAFKNLLNSWKIKNPFMFFGNGKEALDFISIKEASALPDVLLLDLNMPVMNGWKFLENFDVLAPRLGKKISVYLVSSSIWEEDLEQVKKHPLVKGLIVKPVRQEKLLEMLK